MPEDSKNFLDFSQSWSKIVVECLDEKVEYLHSGDPKKIEDSFHTLNQFKTNDNAWTRVDAILKLSKSQKTKEFALDILGNFIKTNWIVLSCHQRLGFKKYIIKWIMEISGKNALSKEDVNLLNVFNRILLQILEYDYPHEWPTFLEDLLIAGKTGTNRCLNSFAILKAMRQKIFGISDVQMSCLKAKDVQKINTEVIRQIFHFCEFVLNTSYDYKSLYHALETVLHFIMWIPPSLIFETTFIKVLIHRFIDSSVQCIILRLLNAIVHLCGKKHNEVLVDLFSQFIENQQKVLPPAGNYKEKCQKNPSFKEFLYHLTVFLSSVLKKCGELLQKRDTCAFGVAFHYLLSLSLVDDVKITKLCLEYYNILLRQLCYEKSKHGSYGHQILMLKLCHIIICKISNPHKIPLKTTLDALIKESNIDSVQIYKSMRKILVFLTFLNHHEVLKIIMNKLTNEIDRSGLSANNLRSICCAIVLIRGGSVRIMQSIMWCMPKEEEKKLFWNVIRVLLTLGKQQKEKSKKLIIAFNLMYVIGEYAHYLNSNLKTLKQIVIKLFEFMQEKEGDIQEMACLTLIHITQKCKKKLIENHHQEEIFKSVSNITPILRLQNVSYCYEALGYILTADSFRVEEKIMKERVQNFFAPHNQKLECIFKQINPSPEILKHPRLICDVLYILKINISACKGMGYDYFYQFSVIYQDILMLYEYMSKIIYSEVEKNGIDISKKPSIKSMRAVRKEILKLISTWVSLIKKENQHIMFLEHFTPFIVHYVLGDYCSLKDSLQATREPEVLLLLLNIVKSLKNLVSCKIDIFKLVLISTVNMIKKDFESFPEIRKLFFQFINAVVIHCFEAFSETLKIYKPSTDLEIILHSILWATKHHNSESITIIGLETLFLLLRKIHQLHMNQVFHQNFYFLILENVLYIATDPLHTSGLQEKANIISHMFKLITKDEIKKPLIPVEQEDKISNSQYVRYFVEKFMRREFQHLSEKHLESVINGFFQYHGSIPSLMKYLKNLPTLIQNYEENDKAAVAAAKKNF